MKGWTKDGERVDLLDWQEKEIRAYMEWADSPPPRTIVPSRFMFSPQAVRDDKQVIAATTARLSEHRRKTGNWFPGEKAMRTFRVYRPNPPEGYRESGTANAPDEPQFEGVVFSDGSVCVRWLTAYRSHSVWASLEDLEKVHGHPEYGSVWEWLD